VGRAIGRILRGVRSGKGRCAVPVLRVPCLRVSGLRCVGHEADKLVLRERRRRLFEHRGGWAAEKATLALVCNGRARFQSVAVMRRTGKKKGKYQDGGERKEFHTGLVTK